MCWLEIGPLCGTSETHQWQPGRCQRWRFGGCDEWFSGQGVKANSKLKGQVSPIFYEDVPILNENPMFWCQSFLLNMDGYAAWSLIPPFNKDMCWNHVGLFLGTFLLYPMAIYISPAAGTLSVSASGSCTSGGQLEIWNDITWLPKPFHTLPDDFAVMMMMMMMRRRRRRRMIIVIIIIIIITARIKTT